MEKVENGRIAKPNFFHNVTTELKAGLVHLWREMGSGYLQNILTPSHLSTWL